MDHAPTSPARGSPFSGRKDYIGTGNRSTDGTVVRANHYSLPSYDPQYQSTPKSKGGRPLGYSPAPPSTAASSYRSPSPNRGTPPKGRSNSPTRMYNGSPPRQNYVTDLERSTIEKQRKELQLLIGELKDRDRELNDMVSAHQKQLASWEADRQRVLTLEQRCSRLEGELRSRSEDLKHMHTQIKVVESQDQSKSCALESTQAQLVKESERASQAEMRVEMLNEKNESLNTSLRDISTNLGHLEAREQELATLLQLKDKDLMEASSHITEMSTKLKRLDLTCRECQKVESNLRREMAEWKSKYAESRKEIDRFKEEMTKQHADVEAVQDNLRRAQNELEAAKKDLILSAEREKRKDQLLELQRSKQERTDQELASLRQIYERQQRDITLLQLNLDNSKDRLRSSGGELELSGPRRSSSPYRPSLSPRSSPIRPLPSPTRGNPGHESTLDGNSSLNRSSDNDNLSVNDLETASPTSKLHRLLEESRQMVASLEEHTTLPLPPNTSKQMTEEVEEEAEEEAAEGEENGEK
ncbi:CCDC62 [Branchiostoma lanceolatum]|uniref:CCDC62 protein n=1 Tax=Branchiostoma lanceolatum TaxID=7740 RepID=A0A8J9VDZ7_BRALA|nr:CCDC62 [Branchiostoma lanceolatum]